MKRPYRRKRGPRANPYRDFYSEAQMALLDRQPDRLVHEFGPMVVEFHDRPGEEFILYDFSVGLGGGTLVWRLPDRPPFHSFRVMLDHDDTAACVEWVRRELTRGGGVPIEDFGLTFERLAI